MTYPREFFATYTDGEQPGVCFVLMPFAENFAPVYEAIEEALESSEIGFDCRRADEFFGGHQIMEDVLREIAGSQLIVADVTGRNPNVFYELGIAHMAKDAERILLVTQRMEDVPFDLRAYRHIVYSSDERGLRELRRKLAAAAREVAGACYRFALKPHEQHETPPLFPAPDRCLYSMKISKAMVGLGFAKCLLRVDRHVVGEDPQMIKEHPFGFGVGEARQPVDALPWALRLDSAGNDQAAFSIVPVKTK